MTDPTTAPPPIRLTSSDETGVVRVVRRLRADVPAEAAVAVVQHLDGLPRWERKVRAIDVTSHGPRCGRYVASGRVGGLLPWTATFAYTMTANGFRSWTLDPSEPAISGGFGVTAHGDTSCTIVHHERYESELLRHPWVRSAWRRYVSRTMDAELARIVRAARADATTTS